MGVAAAILSGGAFAAGYLLQSFAIAVAGGFASAAIATGSLKAGLWGAVSAAAFWGIGTAFSNMAFANVEAINAGSMNASQLLKSGLTSGQTIAKIAAHAGAGGTLSVLQGGKFGHGFVSAGFTEALSPAVGQIEGKGFGSILARTAVSAAIGGTASKLSGGSFANGAQTGAFQQLFNDCVHPDRLEKTLTDGAESQSTDVVANQTLLDSGDISVDANGRLTVNIKYHSDLSTALTKAVIGDIKSYWRSKIVLHFERVQDPALANYFLTDGTADILAITCGIQSDKAWIPAQVNKIGGNIIKNAVDRVLSGKEFEYIT